MKVFIWLLFIGGLMCLLRAGALLLSLKQKRVYPPPMILKQQAVLFGFLGGVTLLCTVIFRVFG
jgi:hypothetical protein